ncbi:hypothetical protein ES707_01739 [subsurface metagenome]
MIKRTLFNELKIHLKKKEISFIVGPRQAGKTTLMLMLKDYLLKRGENIVFLNLDIEMDKVFFSSQEKLMGKIQLEIGKKQGYVFIDEIQRKSDAGIFLKGIYDQNLPYKLIVSGSGSVELKEQIYESLVGRKRVFELSTITFDEFVSFKTDYRYERRLEEFYLIEKQKTKNLLEEYLVFGGYPRVVLEETMEEKVKLMDEIYQSYLEKDLSYLLRVQKTDSFFNLVKLIAAQTGRLINYSELSNTLGLAIKTLKTYLWYMEKTFILNRVNPFFSNKRKEITKSPIYYFYDLGLKNYAVNSFRNIESLTDIGFQFQNFVFNILKEKIKKSSVIINFWRTKEKAEVDFVINSGRGVIPVEVKYRKLEKPEIQRSMQSFIKKYQPKKAFIVNLEMKKKVIRDKTEIYFMPFYEISKVADLIN